RSLYVLSTEITGGLLQRLPPGASGGSVWQTLSGGVQSFTIQSDGALQLFRPSQWVVNGYNISDVITGPSVGIDTSGDAIDAAMAAAVRAGVNLGRLAAIALASASIKAFKAGLTNSTVLPGMDDDPHGAFSA